MFESLSGYPSGASKLPVGSAHNRVNRPTGGSDLGIVALLHRLLNLVFIATTEPRDRTYRRLVRLGWLLALLLVLGCALGIAWRWELPVPAELPIPVIMI